MKYTVKSYNTPIPYSTYPVKFKYEDQLVVMSKLYEFQDEIIRTRVDWCEFKQFSFDLFQN